MVSLLEISLKDHYSEQRPLQMPKESSRSYVEKSHNQSHMSNTNIIRIDSESSESRDKLFKTMSKLSSDMNTTSVRKISDSQHTSSLNNTLRKMRDNSNTKGGLRDHSQESL